MSEIGDPRMWLTVSNPTGEVVSVMATTPIAVPQTRQIQVLPNQACAINMAHKTTIQFGDGLIVGPF